MNALRHRIGRTVVAALLGAVSLLALACRAAAPVPTYRVEHREFDHRVDAEGFLIAGSATQVVVPTQVRHGGRILWMAADGTEVAAGQVVMRLDHYELEQQLERELAELMTADVERQRTSTQGRSSVDDAITRKDLAGLELDHAERFRRDDDSVFSRSEILDSRITEELARVRQGRAAELETIEGERARAQVDRVDVQRRVAGLEVDLARAALKALELRAPRGGVLIWSRDWRGETAGIGEQVFRGQVVAEIPDLEGLVAEVFVLEADADGLAVGRPASISIDARPGQKYAASVMRVDPIAQRRFRGSPAQYVGVTLALGTIDPQAMKPGQRVTASIKVGDQPSGLVVPRLALFVDEGGYFVYLASDDGGFEKRPVAVRDTAPGVALLESGLEEGAVVALEEPTAATHTDGEDPEPSRG